MIHKKITEQGRSDQTERIIREPSETITTDQNIFQPFTKEFILSYHHRCFTCLGLSPRTLQHFEAGYYSSERGFMARALVVRLHDRHGQPLGYAVSQGAPPDCKRWQKWKKNRNFPQSKLIYNWHRATLHNQQPLIITQGPWAVMKLYQVGFKNVIAPFEPRLTMWQFRIITASPTPRIYILMAGDNLGITSAQRLNNILGARAKRVFMPSDLEIEYLSNDQLAELLAPYGE
ncbi:hypothetical protein ACFL27_28260 [candidate division CSSED10-310 bacterium]|uniref:Uncharacterized protein n=1 Tax=candidate division CSSED10-310 bacterium TaxID=2855610 RepID=A0ABV6Z6L8_UNCC1